MRPSSSEDEDPPLEPSQRGLPAQTPVSKGGVRRSPTGILVVVEIQMALVKESWCH
jgi:hypothetical protein